MKRIRVPLSGMLLLPLFFLAVFPVKANEAAQQPDPLRSAALSGDAGAQLKLASEFFFGTETRPLNPVLAVYWFRKAAEQGDAEGLYNLGICLEKGWGVEQPSPVQAYAHFNAAAAKGLPEAKLRKALLLATGIPEEKREKDTLPGIPADRAESLRLLRELAAARYLPAERELARMLLNDLSRRHENGAEARKLLARAAETGDVESLLLLAACLRDGIGGPGDNAKAVEYYEQAVRQGNAAAKVELAAALEQGTGVKADPQRAVALLREAAESGDGRAQIRLGDSYLYGTLVKQSVAEAMNLYRRAFDSGYLSAAVKLGRCAELGLDGAPDPTRAAELYGIAARAGDPDGQYAFARCHKEGIGMEKDAAGAVFWFKTATAAGQIEAVRELAICYLTGVGVEQDEVEGGRLLEAAAAAGDVKALMLINNN